MIRVVFLFLFLAVMSYLGIKAAEKITGQKLIKLTKVVSYVIISSSLAMVLMMFMVYLF